jgi:hypothetical protein
MALPLEVLDLLSSELKCSHTLEAIAFERKNVRLFRTDLVLS